MTVTALDVGRTVTWTDHGRTHTGVLHRCPTEGTAAWWRTHGKATVLVDHDGQRHWHHVHPHDLDVDPNHPPADQEATAP